MAGQPQQETPEPNPWVAEAQPVAHGSAPSGELAAHGLSSDTAVDFSVNTNPLGPSEAVLRAAKSADVSRYPDATALSFRRAIANRLDVGAHQIVAGNGSIEIIWLAALAFARPSPECVLIAAPTFGEYARGCRLVGSRVIEIGARAERDFDADASLLASEIAAHRPRLVWLCNPNNPTSTYMGQANVELLLGACARVGALLVVDEAYAGFVAEGDDLLPLVGTGQLFLLRSMTKDHGVPGLRLGYGVGSADIAGAIRAAQPPWSVSAPAQAAGIAALDDVAHVVAARAEVNAARPLLVEGLRRLGLHVIPPRANFVLVDVSPAWGTGAALRARLLPLGCVLRDCASFGLPGYVRIAIRTRSECARLLEALEQVAEDAKR